MRYSPSVYQMSPNFESPVPHFCSEKSSVRDAAGVLALVFAVFVLLAFPEFVLAFATRTLLFELFSFPWELMLATRMIITSSPMPMMPTTTTPPTTHQTTFDFFSGGLIRCCAGVHGCGGRGGTGVHC